MNLPFYIARHFQFDESDGHRMSRPAVRIATAGIAVGLAVMLAAVAVVVGFKQEVSNQIVGFGSHIQVANYAMSDGIDAVPIAPSDSLMQALAALPHIERVQRIAEKPGIVKTDDDFEGIVLKGVDGSFDWNFFRTHLVAGDTLTLSDSTLSNQAMISRHTADLLRLQVGDKFNAYFVGNPVRARRFTVCGIYETAFADFDKLYVLADLRQVQKLNGWDSLQISKLELLVDDFSALSEAESSVFFATITSPEGSTMQTRSIKKIVPRMFEWLDMLDVNAWVILALMLAVAGFNMISGLLIIILERTNAIGMLKAMGARNWTIRKVFICQSAFLIGKGMFWGNVVGCALVLIESLTHAIPLDPAMYYVSYVPVSLNLDHWLLINVGTLLLTLLMLIAPSHIVAHIQPAKAIKFD
jgi:lipoprotein-releasing system permease protein